MGYRTPTSTASPTRARCSPTGTASRAAPPAAPRSSPGSRPSAPASPRSACPARRKGCSKEDPTLAELLKPLGYATGQFGKNHLGDRNEFLPTVHGFDEFFGNLYHLNAEEEPENVDYPKDPEFKAKFGPRGVFHCSATDTDDPTVDPRFGKLGKQTCEDTGPLTSKRMETMDEEVTAGAMDFMDKAAKDGKPFFVWWNTTRMHIFTHLKPESAEGKTGLGVYADGMVEHDAMVGQLLDKLKELGIEDNTIVMYSTDNGAEAMSWPDGGTTLFRGEKNTNWEGGYRVPTLIRWPGVIKPGTDHQRHRCARGHGADADRRGRGHHRQGGLAEGPQNRRQDLQGPPRRLQPDARAQGRRH